MHTSLRAALFVLSSTVVVACSGAAPDAPENSKSTNADGASPSGSGSGSQSGNTKKSDDKKADTGSGEEDPAPPGGSCPKIEGTYEGPVTGKAALLGDDLKDPVDGAARVTFAAGSESGSYAITDGAIDVTIKTLTSIRVALEVAGDVKCGKLEAKLTGIVSPMAVAPGEVPEFANMIAPGLAAPHHQHLFSARLDFDVDGAPNSVYEVEAEVIPPGPDNPWKNAFRPKVTRLDTERAAQRDMNAATSRTWRIVNEHSQNRLGSPVAYKLIPTMSTPTMLADPDSSVGRRAGFARHNLWVTPYAPDERRAAGEYPNQSAGGDGLPRWTAADRSIVDTDIVVWYTFGVTHFVRPEDWPVMPVEYTGFLLSPYGFFDRNPTLDLPPSSGGACHA